jgi:hypothetical protein
MNDAKRKEEKEKEDRHSQEKETPAQGSAQEEETLEDPQTQREIERR